MFVCLFQCQAREIFERMLQQQQQQDQHQSAGTGGTGGGGKGGGGVIKRVVLRSLTMGSHPPKILSIRMFRQSIDKTKVN